MARQTYITKNGAEKTFDVGQFRTLIRYRQEVQNTEERRKSLNEIMMDLADSVHASFSAVKHWYSGHNGPGSIEMISQIADYLGVETEKLLADPEDAVKRVFKNVETVYCHCTSVVYYIKERLVLHAAEAEDWAIDSIKDIVRGRLAQLGANTLLSSSRLWQLQITADGQTLCFPKGVDLNELKQVMNLVNSAEDIDLYMNYDYHGAFELAEYLDTLEPMEMKGIFYTMYHTVDCDPSLGPLLAYGEKAGVFHTGKEIERKAVEEIPADAAWEADISDVIFDSEDMEEFKTMDADAISRVCHALTAAFDPEGAEPIIEDEKGIYFCLNNTVLRSAEDIRKYCTLVGELVRLTDDLLDRPCSFTEVGPSGPRTMQIDFDKNGTPTILIAQV